MSSFSKTSCRSKTDDVMVVYRLLYMIPFTIYSVVPMWELHIMSHLGSSSYVQHGVCLLCRIWDLLLKSRLVSSVKFHLDLPSVPIWDLPFISHLGSFPCVPFWISANIQFENFYSCPIWDLPILPIVLFGIFPFDSCPIHFWDIPILSMFSMPATGGVDLTVKFVFIFYIS